MPGSSINLRPSEIERAFNADENLRRQFPPILSPDQVGQMLGLARATIYQWIAEGRLDGTFRKRGKHVCLWRDRVLDRIFNGPDWSN